MGCIRSKTCEFENSIQSKWIQDQHAYVEIHEITDISDSLVKFIATAEMPYHSAQPSLLAESSQPAESEEDPSYKTRETLPLHEPESSEAAKDENRDSASPTTFIWLSFDAKVEIPVIIDISEAPVNICVAANVYEPPGMPTLLEAPECDSGMSNNIGQIQEQTDPEPEDDANTSSSLLLDLQNPDTGSDLCDGQGAEGASNSLVEPRSHISLSNYNLGEVLGYGSYGKVFLAEHKETKEVCAIKALKKTRIVEQKDLESVFKEKEILHTISCSEHPFLVSLYGTFQTDSHLFYAMEYLPGGDMFEFLTYGELEEQDVMFYSACVVLGLEALHQIGIVHRDLKLENLLMDRDGFVKIVDFGLSKNRFGYNDRTKTKCGTRACMAPEIYMNIGYGMAVDWWALGIAMYAMLMYELPFNNEDPFELAESILYDEIELPEYLSEDVCGVINELLVKDPEFRLGSGEAGADMVKEHPFFIDMDWKKLKDKKVRPPFVPANQGHLESLRQPECRAPALTLPSVELPSEHQEAFREFDFTPE